MSDVQALPVSPASHIATILAADAVGYSRAMSRDEAAALAALAASRRLIDPLVAEHAGRVFAAAGDSVLAEFAEADTALRCALAIQRRLAAQAPGTVLTYRIGLHRGRVYESGADLLGDTVNVAARLESIAEAGGITLSGQVAEALGHERDVEIEPLGLQILKHIRDPVRVLRVRLGERTATRSEGERRLRVAVLPFRVMGDGSPAYLAEGLADDLITGLSRFRNLAVMARSASFQFAPADATAKRVAADLNVRFVVGGSLARHPGGLHLAVELVDGLSGDLVWAERYDAGVEGLLHVQDQVVAALVATLVGRLEDAAIEGARHKPPESAEAFDLFLKGLFHAHRTDRAANAQALDYLQRAVEQDPDYALAWAWLGLMQLRRWAWQPHDSRDLAPAMEFADRALALDPAEGWCHLVAGQIAMYLGDLILAESRHKKASALNPYDPHIMALRSPLATYLGKPEEGLAWIDRAIRLNPRHPDWYATNRGFAAYCARRYAEAVETYADVVEPQAGVLAGLAASYAMLGDRHWARQAADRLLQRQPDFSTAVFVRMRPFRHESDRAHLVEGLAAAGLPG